MIQSARYSSANFRNRFVGGLDAGTDSDAARFIEAAGIYDSRQQRAVYELVRLLKNYGIWSKMKAVYPFVGGTASTHKWNLKDPQDTDGAFRLTFNGGWTHSDTGALPNGTNAWANTYITPTTHLIQNSTHLSYYSRSNIANNGTDIGMYNPSTSPNSLLQLVVRYSDGGTNNIISGAQYSVNDGCTGTNVLDGRIMAISSRTSSTYQAIFLNATRQQTSTRTAEGWAGCNRALYLCGRNNSSGTQDPFSSKECAFASIGDGLDDTEAANLYYAVDYFQRILGRAV